MGCAGKSAGLADGTGAGKEPAKRFAEQILKLDGQPARAESILHKKYMEIPCAENILETNGAGGNILAGILAETRDASRFDDVKEIQKLSGTGLASCSCGRHKGQAKIAAEGAGGSGTGCSRLQNQRFCMQTDSDSCMCITQHGPATR